LQFLFWHKLSFLIDFIIFIFSIFIFLFSSAR